MNQITTESTEQPSGAITAPRRSIRFRLAMLTWVVTIVTLCLFVLIILPYERGLLIDRLETTAEVIATAVDQVTVTSVVVEDYSPVIEHCLKVVGDRPSILYLVITRRDGFSLQISAHEGWRHVNLAGFWRPEGKPEGGEFIESDFVNQQVYHYSYPLGYSGIDWGWIHVGISTSQFDQDLSTLYLSLLLIALVCVSVASVISFGFSRRLTSPILDLNRTARQIAAGDLESRASIRSDDEVGSLATSFNQMADALQKTRETLEDRVVERTAELQAANMNLTREIAERVRAEQARVVAEGDLENQRTLSMRSDRLRSLGEMAAGIAHELNQPLVGVRGIAEHLLIGQTRGWDLSEEKLKERLSRIVEQADRMVHIIDHVRMFAREAGKPSIESVEVNAVIQSGIDMLGAQFRSHGLGLECELSESLPPVSANPFSLEEVILNLLSNARDALDTRGDAREDSPCVWIRTRPEPNGPGPRVRIDVSDNGMGIPPEILSKVMDPFFTTKDSDKGTGLGLSISKSIVEEFGGSLVIESNSGKGTTVSILLPAVDRRGRRDAGEAVGPTQVRDS